MFVGSAVVTLTFEKLVMKSLPKLRPLAFKRVCEFQSECPATLASMEYLGKDAAQDPARDPDWLAAGNGR